MEAQPPFQQTHILQNSVVVFSKNYLPLSRINIKRAIVLLVTGQAESLNFDTTKQWEIRSPSVVLQVPEHIRLTVGNPERHWKIPPVNRREVLKRDNHTCQYCGSTKRLTLDHVIPRSKGGQHTWDNVVTACDKCNSIKSDRLLYEAGMVLKTKPKAPIHPAVAFAEQFWNAQRLTEKE
ncbi:HNH endonuclease [Anabaena cylindrica FACHB-243]|uniref:HNH endonuclease n=1 Tax=Anabaena cylindrica (strain ATCC 27899 / PCC 7122) TaxID=272123 RepID=K9ZEJ9_ANACC|nr:MULTISPECIES: HNH endonuclease [Anabaena]AFZ57638.1 HNH endonuclease [Anabaena cylindrica PCC 7122]MBD2421848.1 HNH endonuclease [Anabaena cylindrica FACHB-243]MBY5284936.1 HNH endonuclease [Anabaena sp. CCAP 1446/1C]MBY5310645.1 HNH endonuclease [Anabaena sp. CCAP 1446/1C]MCM2410259.1 HNH endonuclease [Anabaena sp. CCAP 1446/1C]